MWSGTSVPPARVRASICGARSAKTLARMAPALDESTGTRAAYTAGARLALSLDDAISSRFLLRRRDAARVQRRARRRHARSSHFYAVRRRRLELSLQAGARSAR